MHKPLELWGGPECTVNRVGDAFGDQFRLSGHHDRLEDLDLFADLGITAIRYPILWERVAPERPDQQDWAWSDERLARLRELNIAVIAGLVHHGSGPHYTSLVDDGFPAGLARHARDVAERYPWIDSWTPVNEPLTTARFSALYGHWHPHSRDEAMFWRALINQIDGVRLSMQAVRRVNPAARLIQTDDLGRTFATVTLREQALFDNLRRWAGWDLLCGRVTRNHPLWERIARHGLADRLSAIADDPCPPDVIGVNHYLTSDRFLDHRLSRYPDHVHGGNDRLRYADVEAVRVLNPGSQGLRGVLNEAWSRYGIPLAITEVHNGCTREEQMRWMAEAWDMAVALRDEGVPIKAVTSWALLGSNGWNTLLTEPGLYEPGVFDVSSGTPRPTAMVPLLKGLPSGAPRHPVTQAAGWWRRPIRLVHAPVPRPASAMVHFERQGGDAPPPLLICGAAGTMGQAFVHACALRNIPFVLADNSALEPTDPQRIVAVLDEHRPWAAVNAGGWDCVDEAERDPDACHRDALAADRLAAACEARGIASLNFSSDLVFDGDAATPYSEEDRPNPLNAYGRSKAAMEQAVLGRTGSHLVIRTAGLFSPFDERDFTVAAVRALARDAAFPAAADITMSPTYLSDLVKASLDLLIDGERGIRHVTNGRAMSWASFAREIASACGLDDALVRPVPAAELGWVARRPAQSALRTVRGSSVRPLDEAILEYAREWQAMPVERSIMVA